MSDMSEAINDIQARTDALYDRIARDYESEPGHGIVSDDEREAWETDLAPILAKQSGNHVVDIGCGTGVLTRMLADLGCTVRGIDSSSQMIAVAQSLLTPTHADRVTYSVGNAHQADVETASVAAVWSRQVVCHLHDPLRAFRQWHDWLKPNGVVVVIDGFWARQGWADGSLASTVDQLPLNCVQTTGTVAYLLRQACFDIEHQGFLERVNHCAAINEPGAIQRSPRYVVVARKPAVM